MSEHGSDSTGAEHGASGADWVDRWVVETNYDGWRLDQYLAQKLKRATRSQVRRILQGGAVRFADGRRARPASRVRPGDVVELPRVERADPDTPSLDDVRVLYDADDVLVLDKPAGMLVHRTAHEATRTIEAWLAARIEGRCEPVHRLDRDTSGCLVCARGDDAIRELRSAFADSSAAKRYVAWAHDPGGVWQIGDQRTLDTPLGLDPDAAVRLRMGRGSLPAVTDVRCTDRLAHRAVLDVRITFGRQHQIRAHLAMAGTPVVADKLYGMGDDFFVAWLDAPACRRDRSATERARGAGSCPAACPHGWRLRVSRRCARRRWRR